MSNSETGEPLPRLVIDDVQPALDCGRHPVKRTVGDVVLVSARAFTHGHDVVGAALRWRRVGAKKWTEVGMAAGAADVDRFAGEFPVTEAGRFEFAVVAWIDRVATWRDELRRRIDAGQSDLAAELADGARLLGVVSLDLAAALRATGSDRHDTAVGPRLEIDVDPELATFGAWYELFPRSFDGLAGVEAQLPALAALGFDVVYLTPIHPIGITDRKGPDNTLRAREGDPGSPWAIGGPAGGHTAVHPDLGTIDDFDHLVTTAREHGLSIALDFAVQSSPDHPWLREHPEWFSWRPDGTVKHAENPPKRYQDIVNFDFESPDWRGLWQALLDVVRFWVGHGVRVYRVDNPHTKPVAFWEWLIREVRTSDPDVIFLAEAFTRPAMMQHLAKIGFNQSYTYFTWRNTRAELEQYVTELAGEVSEYFRPNFFVNTPDILHEYLQRGGGPAFEARLVLAATLSPSYGIYSGYEHGENTPLRPGSEEYLRSEKYELKERALDGPLLPLVSTLNEIRRSCAPFRRIDNIIFLESHNDQLLAYAKESGDQTVVVCVNLDPLVFAEGDVDIPPSLRLQPTFEVTDLLTGSSYPWRTGSNYVLLGPGRAHVMRIR